MTTHDDETLMAYADGELDPAGAAAVEAAMAANPEVAARVAAFGADRRRLSERYGPVADEAVPDALIHAVLGQGSAPVIGLEGERERRAGSRRWAAWQAPAMAACLAAGVAIGLLAQVVRQPLVEMQSGLTASGALARALDRQLSGETGAIRVGLSFKAKGGDYCRTFQAGAEKPLAGVACRETDGWKIQLVMEQPPAAQGEYRLAAGDLPVALLGAVEGLIEGVPLDQAGEVAARKGDWRSTPAPR